MLYQHALSTGEMTLDSFHDIGELFIIFEVLNILKAIVWVDFAFCQMLILLMYGLISMRMFLNSILRNRGPDMLNFPIVLRFEYFLNDNAFHSNFWD